MADEAAANMSWAPGSLWTWFVIRTEKAPKIRVRVRLMGGDDRGR